MDARRRRGGGVGRTLGLDADLWRRFDLRSGALLIKGGRGNTPDQALSGSNWAARGQPRSDRANRSAATSRLSADPHVPEARPESTARSARAGALGGSCLWSITPGDLDQVAVGVAGV